jgi:hypothetical protein
MVSYLLTCEAEQVVLRNGRNECWCTGERCVRWDGRELEAPGDASGEGSDGIRWCGRRDA